ncbi:TRAP transporter small permease [Vineibacter terrae]|uniref:TRAP transporter small permease protein n=1 Tax=Vineibacter terrae TaxID=2586908 RepID=A0A5C8PA46_9HYPH|nr:TRAP transporter small permease [Vineibacter terrae]TXL70229.1 TRAP transporter small permease [Vineibacter terrae]
MRAYLRKLYEAAGALGGLFMILLLVFVLYSVGPGVGLWLEQQVGLPNPFNYVARSADEFAGYAMLASAFLAMASTFGRGEHIRVTLFLQRLRGRARRYAELWCLALGSLLAGYLAWFSVRLCYVSWQLNDVSTGLIAVPLWIPQLGMAIGAVVLAIAVVEQLVVVAMGGPLMEEPSGEEAMHIER